MHDLYINSEEHSFDLISLITYHLYRIYIFLYSSFPDSSVSSTLVEISRKHCCFLSPLPSLNKHAAGAIKAALKTTLHCHRINPFSIYLRQHHKESSSSLEPEHNLSLQQLLMKLGSILGNCSRI